MAVHHGVDVGPRLVGAAVDEALQEHAAVALIDRVGVKVELHDVLDRDQRRRPRARHQIALRIARVPHRHVAPGVEHAVLRQDPARGDQVFDQPGVDRTGRGKFCFSHGKIQIVKVSTFIR